MRYLIYLSFIVSISLNAGGIHKWVDEDGNVYYGDAPPVTVQSKEVRVIGAPSDPGKALPRLGTGNESAPESDSASNSTADKSDPSTVPEDQAKIACDLAKKDLKVIKRSNRIKLQSADGSSRFMTTEEIAERRKNAEKDVKYFCK